MSEPVRLEEIDDALIDMVVEIRQRLLRLEQLVQGIVREMDLDFEVPDVGES